MKKNIVLRIIVLYILALLLASCNVQEDKSRLTSIPGEDSAMEKRDYVILPNESLSFIDFNNPGGYSNDFVPDAEMAYNVAMVYLTKQFGNEFVQTQKPYKISYDNDLGLWMICGTVIMDYGETGGGAINIVIRKKDGRIMLIAAEA